MNIKILVAVHKQHWVPSNDMYMPIHAGKAIADVKMDYPGDDSGDNISAQNDKYSELTAIYWAWKNLDADAIGLVHYRRYLAEPGLPGHASTKHPEKRILTKKTAEQILGRVDAILPQRRNYVIETIYSHYDHTHDGEHLRVTGKILREKCPEYIPSYESVLKRTSAHMFNMFVMKRETFCAYCEWLFPILEEVNRRIDDTGMSSFERRYVGRIGEILLNVWLNHNHITYEEVPYIQLGKTNWFKKVRSFLAAKFRHKKYEQSI